MATVEGATVLLTGGQRGLGRQIVQELLGAGAAKIYVTSRTPAPESDPRLVPLWLELADEDAAGWLARTARDVSIVVNNAAAMTFGALVDADEQEVKRVFEIVAYGPLRVARAFAPILAANGGGALINVHSLPSGKSGLLDSGTYGVSQYALNYITNSLRVELARQGTQVLGVQLPRIDTDLVELADASYQCDPGRAAAASIIRALQKGESELAVSDDGSCFHPGPSGLVEGRTAPC